MYKRLLLLTLVLLFSLSFSGCGLLSGVINNYKSNKAIESSQENLTDVKKRRMSESSMEAVEEAQKAIDGYAEAVSDFNDSGLFGKLWKSLTNSKGKARAKMEEANTRVDKELRDDKTYQDSLNQEAQMQKQENNRIVLLVLVGLVVIAVILILVLVLVSRPKRIKQDPEIVDNVPTVDVDTSGDVAVNYDKLLKSNCKKLNLDYDEQLNKYDGDVRKAAEQTQLML